MDNVHGHIHGQLARPHEGSNFPALLILQWAGVYALQTNWVTDRAAAGWLVLNIEAHDLPIHESEDFYRQQANGPLKNYLELLPMTIATQAISSGDVSFLLPTPPII